MDSQATQLAVRAYSYIRFSTPEQQHGDSLRRQLEASVAYAAERGLVLDDQLNMRDLGVSAFRGANVEKGRLGAFIKAVETGLVPRGSFLLVESLDRLSRAEVLDALQIFTTIVNLGITIVTLIDEREYSRSSLSGMGSMDLVFSLIIMSRAYEESATKSTRRRKTWNQQKRAADSTGKKMTKKLPFWLSLPDPDGEFVVVEEAAAVVRRVFELSKAGLGFHKIAQALNADKVPSPAARSYTTAQKYEGNQRTWATSSIGYLLRNEAVIGNLVMTEVAPEKNEAPVPHRLNGYYPRIIDDELFYAIQGKRQAPKGKASALKTNLFTGLLFCGYCRGPMQVDTNTKATYRRSRISCQRKRRGFRCICRTWPYEEFEEHFFTFVQEVDLASIVTPNKANTALEDEISELTGKLAVVDRALARFLRIIADRDDPPRTIVDAISGHEKDKDKLETDLRIKSAQLKAERSYHARAEQEIAAIRGQFTTLNQLSPEERVVSRYAIAEHIAAVVDSIHLCPNGSLMQEIEVGPGEDEPDDDAWSPPDTTPFFIVKFRNGWSGVVKPSEALSHRMDLRGIELPPGLKKRGE